MGEGGAGGDRPSEAAALSVCLVTTFYPPANFGGDGVHVQRLASLLAARGCRVRVVHNPDAHRLLAGGRAAVGATLPHEGWQADPGVEVVAVAGGGPAVAATYLLAGSKRHQADLAALVDGFDVVHFHNPSLIGGPRAFGLGSGVRLYTTHEHWLLCPTHVLFRYGREVCTRPTCVSCTLVHRRPPQLWRSTGMLDRAVDDLHAILCPSRFTAALHRRRFPSARIEVLPLPAPVPGPGAGGVESPPGAASPFFLYAGRLEPIKGVDRLVRAFASVRGAALVIAGTGSQWATLRAQAAGMAGVTFTGPLPQEQVLALCRDALAVVVPSAGYETFGGVAVEAMAMGTPAVVADIGPLPELVEDGGGLTFGDEAELATVLQGLVDEPGRVTTLGQEARRVAAERHGPEGFLAAYLSIVAAVATASGRPELARRARAAAPAGHAARPGPTGP